MKRFWLLCLLAGCSSRMGDVCTSDACAAEWAGEGICGTKLQCDGDAWVNVGTTQLICR